ncbi:MAG: beta-lactamase family protein [Flavobacteriales bacterium]|jgi:CubicO group peptidase (beta-lactamase class C family)|nr:beta-lactamase family protein [Flavobacteriales bacterium]
MQNHFFLSIGILLFFFSCAEPTQEPGPRADREIVQKPTIDSTAYYDSLYAPLAFQIDTFFQKRFQAKTFNGTILFAKENHIILKKAYGFSSLDTKDSLTTASTFQLASASKPFTAIACLQLIEKGKLKLTDSVQQYLPHFPYNGITIHQLLSHRSGLSQYTHFCDAPDSIWPDKHKTITNEDVLEIMHQYQPGINYAPDTKFYYCNTNYMLLASIVEQVAKIPFEDYLKQHIFTPLGMKNTVVYNRANKDELKHPVKAYNGAYNPYIDIYLNGVVGDKGVYSSVEDLYLFYSGLSQGKLIKKETLTLAIQPHNEPKKDGKNYGYGFRILEQANGENIIFHTGWWKGFRTYFILNQQLNKTAIVLTNLKRGPFLSVKELLGLID